MVKNMSGIVFNGLYLVQKEPSKGDKGLLVNGKYFIPVTNESSGAVASYYKCASVTPGVSGAVIEVTGDTTYGCNGTYTIVDATATGKNRTWRTSDGVWEIRNTNATAGIDRWCIFDVASDIMKIRSVMTTVPDNPWEVTSWQNDTSPYAYPDLVLTPYDTAKTWSGYKAVLNNGVYTFENTVTQGLVYTSITPVIGNIYSTDALVKVSYVYTGTANIPTQGLIFYASLAEDSTAETGQDVTTYGNISWGIISGIPCATFTNNSYLKYSFSEISGNEPSTLSAWLNSKTDPDTLRVPYQCGVEFTGTRNNDTIRQIGVVSDNYLGGAWYGSELGSSIKAYNTGWHNVVITYDYPTGKLYVDGVFQSSGTFYLNTTTGYLSIGADVNGDTPFSGGIASCRVYDRALNEEEILALSKEFYI